VHCDVVSEALLEDPPVLRLPVQRLVTRSHPGLHDSILCRIHIVSRAFDFVRVAAVALFARRPSAFGLRPSASARSLGSQLKEVTKNLVEYENVGTLNGIVGALDSHQVPCQDVHAQPPTAMESHCRYQPPS
jgi:hypothetical protein